MNENIQAFLKVLDPSDRTAAGGTASAIAGAMAGALTAMVAELSINRTRLEPEAFYAELAVQSRRLSDDLILGGAQDGEAFAAIYDASRLPRRTGEERALHQKAIQAAWIQATLVPLENAERCAQILELVAELEGRSNPNVISDLQCASHLAHAALHGCLDCVESNLTSIDDQATVEELGQRARRLRVGHS